jgi:hypothetical protein
MELESRVEKLMKSALLKNKKDIEQALIKPISPQWKFSTNGVYFFVGKMGSGKSWYIWKHIYVTERLFKKPYYQLIVYCSTSGKLDQTSETLKEQVTTPIKYVKEKHLVEYLNQHLKWKTKYYSICRHVLSRFRKTDEKMEQIIKKHSLEDLRDRMDYISEKLAKYGTSEYPFRTLLVMDDFATSPLLEKVNSPISKFLTKTRHYHLTAIIVAQTWRFIILNLKRLATDIIVYSHFSDEDFEKILQQSPNNCEVDPTVRAYRSLEGDHDHFIMHITANEYTFVPPRQVTKSTEPHSTLSNSSQRPQLPQDARSQNPKSLPARSPPK